LKQTILFPFVTLGSLINFCDIFMSGGSDRKNHSEVGSSYIHFNYTPNQDKATEQPPVPSHPGRHRPPTRGLSGFAENVSDSCAQSRA
jgi:UDP-N-acetylglucosamine/UDP-N-acetylgalactosamine diphosphorylase